MKESRFTDTQIASILERADAGTKAEDLRRKHRIGPAVHYNRKRKYRGMDAPEEA